MLRDFQGTITQIFDTVTGTRRNVQDLPTIVALSSTRLILNDLTGQGALYDMTTGTRTSIPGIQDRYDQETLAVPTGAVVLSTSVVPENGSFQLAHVTPDGTVTLIHDGPIAPATLPCFNCITPNSVLFGTGEHFVIREINRIIAVRNGDDPTAPPLEILGGLNVIKVSVAGPNVFYLAETTQGVPVSGVFDLETGVDTRFQTPDEFEDIGAVPP